MKFKNYLHGTVILTMFSLFIIGCGSPKVTGKVTFPDGSPLTQGMVYFEKGDFAVTGAIQKDGSFQMGSNGKGNGVPPGTYGVAVTGTDVVPPMDSVKPTPVGPVDRAMRTVRPPVAFKPLVHKKYSSVRTSGLTIEVGNSMTYNIEVEPPDAPSR